MSPLAVLGRGYAMPQREDGSVLRSAADVSAGDKLTVTMGDGAIDCRVEEVRTL